MGRSLRDCLCSFGPTRLQLTLMLLLALAARDQYAHAYSMYAPGSYYSPCVSMTDCGSDYCCAYKSKHRLGFCMPQKRLGELCTTSFLLGKSFSCGCERGLTCAIVEKDQKTGSNKFRCVQIPQETAEQKEANTATRTITKLLTAEELARLLRLLKAKSKIPITT